MSAVGMVAVDMHACMHVHSHHVKEMAWECRGNGAEEGMDFGRDFQILHLNSTQTPCR